MKNHWIEFASKRREYSKYLVCLFMDVHGLPVYYGCQVLAPSVTWNTVSNTGGGVIPSPLQSSNVLAGKYHGFAFFDRAGFQNRTTPMIPINKIQFVWNLELSDGDKFTANFNLTLKSP